MYIEGDIHEVIKTLEENSIDLIYTNPPFGITRQEWDKPLDWDYLWHEIWRVVKPDGIVVLHASMPFSYHLIRTQLPKYHYTIIKSNSTNYLNAKKQPLRNTEELFVFYKKPGCYNPQMDYSRKPEVRQAGSDTKYYGKRKLLGKVKYDAYHPQTAIEMKIKVRGGKTVSDDLIDRIVKTYSNEGDTVLDMTTHNTVVGDRVEMLKRNFIGVDRCLHKGT